MPGTEIVYRQNDNLIELVDLFDLAVNSYLTGATVTLTVFDADGNELAGETWPIPMAYVAGTNGTYRATLVDTLDLSALSTLRAQVTADGGAGKRGFWDRTFDVRTRT